MAYTNAAVPRFQSKPDWTIFKALMNQLGLGAGGLGKFINYCIAKDLAVADVADDDLEAWIASLADRLPESTLKVYRSSVRRGLRKVAQADPLAPLTKIDLAFQFRKVREGKRKAQFEDLPSAFQREFEELELDRWPDREASANTADRNMLLRCIALLEANDYPVRSLADFVELETFNRLTDLKFGGKPGSLAEAQKNFLSAAIDIAVMLQLGEQVRALRQKLQTVKPPGGIEHDELQKVIAFDNDRTAKLIAHAGNTLTLAADNPRIPLWTAQAALAVFAIVLSGQPVREIRAMRFAQPFDRFASNSAQSEVVIAGCLFRMPQELERAVVALRCRIVRITGPDNNAIFVREDGDLKSTSMVTTSVTRLSSAAGVKTDPRTLQGAVILTLLEKGIRWQKVCKHLGWSQERNFFRRFRPLIEFATQGKFADEVEGGQP
jgi:DNA-binding ferritin-like protein (Dps family)